MEKIAGPLSVTMSKILQNNLNFDSLDRDLKNIIMLGTWASIRKTALNEVLNKAIKTKDKGLKARVDKILLKKLSFAKKYQIKLAEAAIAEEAGAEDFSFDEFYDKIIEENK